MSGLYTQVQVRKLSFFLKMDTKLNLEKLVEVSEGTGKSNYISWRFKLNLLLRIKKLFDIATGVTIKPYKSDPTYADW